MRSPPRVARTTAWFTASKSDSQSLLTSAATIGCVAAALPALDFAFCAVYLSASMRTAFKEWAIVVDTLGRGQQIIILRKGGISEGRGGFKLEQPRFLLFPTLFHQQRESVIPVAQARYAAIEPGFPPPDHVRLEYWAEVARAEKLNSLSHARALSGQHIWRDEVITERFDWGRDKSIFALAIRVFSLPQILELPMLPSYGGCKSWIELDQEIDSANSKPVLSRAEFQEKLAAFCGALAGNGSAPSPQPAGIQPAGGMVS